MNNKNTNEQKEIARIIANSIQGTVSKEEITVLQEWLKASPSNKFFYNRFLEEDKLNQKLIDYKNIDISRAKENIVKRIVKYTLHTKIKKYFRYAALIIFIIGSTYFFHYSYVSNLSVKDSIPIDAITLQSDEDKIEIITENRERLIVNKEGEVIGEQKGNHLDYKSHNKSDKLVFNALTIPYGKTFHLVLSDGTKIHLNAGSSLKYPVKFIHGKERQVFLEGEAFFDVAKDAKHPFIVNSNKLNIRVLGTSFNINSYPEDDNINTVLVEGSVSIYPEDESYKNNTSSLLKPGYKASWNKNKKEINLDKVDTNIYTAWTKGKLIFLDMPFKNIRKKLERKYNVKIINNNEILENNTYNAVFDIETIEQVLETLNENFPIEYKIIENQITIY